MAVPSPEEVPTPAPARANRPAVRLVVTTTDEPFPVEVIEFVHRGLAHTVQSIHGPKTPKVKCRHVTGKQLCEGLRDCAQKRWGFMARTVLRRWNVMSTLDFGKIVFMMVKSGLLKTTEGDTLDDFRDVYDFKTLETEYRIQGKR
jgi:uncharacterized repeat protein (TIGR04138 family)